MKWNFFLSKIGAALLLIILIGSGCSYFQIQKNSSQEVVRTPSSLESTPKIFTNDKNVQKIIKEDYYLSKVKPIFDNRCVTCHSCYIAPCQLQLTSYEGVRRGAARMGIYDIGAKQRQPTRLHIDAKDVSEWRNPKFNFSPVINGKLENGETEESSILLKLVSLSKANPYNEHFSYNPENKPICPKNDEKSWDDYLLNKNIGMPYGLPSLSEEQYATLVDWQNMGYPGPGQLAKEALEKSHFADQIEQYEHFFNQKDLKHKLVSRYIYEHLFIGHLYFGSSDREFYRLVRAKNEYGEADEIASRRPYDDPKMAEFFYRFKKITDTITDKSHLPYKLSTARLDRWQNLFFDPSNQWSVEKLPDYATTGENAQTTLQNASNPFKTFADIPAKMRYHFLLDDAHYHTSSFTKGPVCRGQATLTSIDDHLWTFFIDPDKDPLININPNFLKENANLLFPAAAEGDSITSSYRGQSEKFRQVRANFYKKNNIVFSNDMIWNGDTNSQGAAWKMEPDRKDIYPVVTLSRHFESASVDIGAIGGEPKIVWVFDYHIFEELYYNIVAGFDVFGNIPHYLRSRIHMDATRFNSQDMFLSFFPKELRKDLRKTWLLERPLLSTSTLEDLPLNFLDMVKNKITNKTLQPIYETSPWINLESPVLPEDLGQEIGTSNSNPLTKALKVKTALLNLWVREIQKKGRSTGENVDCCNKENQSLSFIERKLKTITREKSNKVGHLPDVVYILYAPKSGETPADTQQDEIYTLVVNKEHFNRNTIFNEEVTRNYDNDYITIYRGFIGNYPNLFVKLESMAELDDFIKEIQTDILTVSNSETNSSKDSWKKFYLGNHHWFINRNDSRFWNVYDRFNQYFLRTHPIEAGVIDLNRYYPGILY